MVTISLPSPKDLFVLIVLRVGTRVIDLGWKLGSNPVNLGLLVHVIRNCS
jgi:hypothetical protein